MAAYTVTFTGETPGKVVKWKVRQGSWLGLGSLLYTYQSENSDTILKSKTPEVGTLLECLVQEGQIVKPGDPVAKIQGCTHPTVMKDMCAECGANLRTSYGRPGDRNKDVAASVAMVHSVPELIVSEEEAIRLGREDERRLLKDRKLALLVDLDQTLLHTTNDNVPACLKDVHHFQMWHGPVLMWYHTKFRPGIHHFLEKISKLYELHICTFGVRMYAHSITSLLDPQGQYFSHRILSRDECFDPTSKTANLRALFPCGDGMVAIIDDREDVWNYSPNLIPVKPYQFFDGTADINAPPGLNKDTTSFQHNGPPRRRYNIVKVPKQKNVSKEKDSLKGSKSDKVNKDKTGTEIGEGSVTSEERRTSCDGGDQSEERKMSVDEEDQSEEQKLSPDVGDNQSEQSRVSKYDGKKSDEMLVSHDSEKLPQKEDVTCEDKPMLEAKKEEEDIKINNMIEKKISEINQPKEGDSHQQSDSKELIACQEKDRETEPMEIDPDLSKESPKSPQVEGDTIPEIRVEDVSEDPQVPPNSTEQASTKPSTEPGNAEPTEERPMEKVAPEQKTVEDSVEYDTWIEWEDLDDYLLYLEDILLRIHKAFYDCYDQSKKRDSKEELPSLKKIIPYVRRKVLKGCNILFSGVFPTNMPPEKNKAFITAKALGANIHTDLVMPGAPNDSNTTTHVVAARLGTAKVNLAKKQKSIHVVRPEWLWHCSDRWERVEEQLYLLTEENSSGSACASPVAQRLKHDNRERTSQKRKSEEELLVCDPGSGKRIGRQYKAARQASDGAGDGLLVTSSGSVGRGNEAGEPQASGSIELPKARQEHERRFSESYNPMYAFSRDDIDDMDREVEDILNASDSDSEDSEDEKKERELRKKVLKGDRDSSSEDSLSGDFPRGWKRKHRKKSLVNPPAAAEETENQEAEDTLEEGEIIDNPNRVFKNSDDSDSDDSDKESFDDSIGSVDEEMAAAVEKEFLN